MNTRLFALASLPLLLAACSGEPAVPAPDASLVRVYGSVGVVRSRVSSLGTETEGVAAFGVFGAFASPQAVPTVVPGVPGSCTVTRSAPGEGVGPVSPPMPPGHFTSLDAGDALTLRTAGGPYARLDKSVFGGQTFYASLFGGEEGATPGPLPAELRLDIPGAGGGFPAFSGVTFPHAPPLDLGAPNLGQPVAADATFTWAAAQAGADTTTVVTLSLIQAGPDGTVGAHCLATDAGSFRLPEVTRNELRQAGFTAATGISVGRLRSRLVRQGDAALVVSASDVLTALTPGNGPSTGGNP